MPIEIHRDDDVPPVEVRPGTNQAQALAVLVKYPDAAFTPAELAERADIRRTSIYKTVDRLIEKGLVVRHPDGDHVHVNHEVRDQIYHRLRSFRDAETFERHFDGDWFSTTPDWADELDDLGRETLPEANSGHLERGRDEDAGFDDLPDLGKE